MPSTPDINIMPPTVAHPRVNQTQVLRKVLTSEETFATTLLVLVIDQWGTEALEWSPTVLRMELEETFDVQLPQENLDKLVAGITIVTTDMFFKDVSRFIQLCNVLAGSPFDPEEFDPADSLECAWGITEALMLSPPDEEDPEPFSDEVRHYVAFVLKEEGYIKAPDILGIALNADLSAQVSTDFADDPEMFQALYSMQQDKATEIDEILKGNLLELLGQLKALPLENGDTAEIEKRLAAMLKVTA